MRKLFNSKVLLILGFIGLGGFSSCNLSSSASEDKNAIVDSASVLKQDGASVNPDSTDGGELPVSEQKPVMESTDVLLKHENEGQFYAHDTSKTKVDSASVKHIYLTFDDGPLGGSQFIDSVATMKGIKLSVFLIGEHDQMSKKMHRYFEKYRANPLIDCYNHSYSHANNKFTEFYSKPQAAFADFDRNERLFGLQHKIARMPGRNIWYFGNRRKIDNKNSLNAAQLLYDNGYKIMGWDCEWKINPVTGNPDLTVNQLYNRMKNLLYHGSSFSKNNVVLLTHDNMYNTKKAQKLLIELIDKLKEHPNFKFEFIKDYPMN